MCGARRVATPIWSTLRGFVDGGPAGLALARPSFAGAQVLRSVPVKEPAESRSDGDPQPTALRSVGGESRVRGDSERGSVAEPTWPARMGSTRTTASTLDASDAWLRLEDIRTEIVFLVRKRIPRVDVEDVVQDVLVGLLQRAGDPKITDWMAFTRATTRNICAEYHRQRGARPGCGLLAGDSLDRLGDDSTAEQMESPSRRLSDRVTELLPRLPARQQRVARAIVAGVRSKRELARSLGLDRSDLREVLSALRRRFER